MLVALYLFFFSAGGVDGLVINIAEPVKQHVLDKATVKQVIAINKEMLKEDADFKKDSATAKKQLAKLNNNRLSSETSFDEVFVALDRKRAAIREKIVENRFRMKELMTAEEWKNVYSAASP